MEMYESVQTCPEELLLWFHHVPYDYRLRSGKTVIQHIYDTHFDGVEQVKGLIEQWQTLKGRIDDERWLHVLDRLHQQLAHATVWRDSINGYFFGLSGVPDARGRSIEVRDPAAKREGRSRIATRDLREDQELLHVELN
jgi:alpha-glucuronidase